MKTSLKKGLSFGLSSGIITTLGLVTGLHAGTQSNFIVISGILVIAVADGLSDAFGIHMSEESTDLPTKREVWESTIMTFISKFVFTLTFIIPFLILNLFDAVIASIIWGFVLISFFSIYIAKERKENPYHAIFEHLIIASLVIIASHFVGKFVASLENLL